MSDKLTYLDLLDISGLAKLEYVDKAFPVYLDNDKRRVGQDYQNIICIVEATISVLNKKGLLKEVPKFDYKENKF